MSGKQGVLKRKYMAHEKMVPAPCVAKEKLQEFMENWGALEQEDLSSSDYYFNSYAHFSIHEEMIKDKVRTGCYRSAMLSNPHLFHNKVVLDIGCGTGILSLFSVKAGAAHVYAVECSEIIHVAEKIVLENHLEHKITFIKGKAEEISLPVNQVDIIISEWMGYMLLYESMLDTVIYMRDKYLKKDGLIFPNKACLYMAGIEDGEYKEEKIGYWSNVYGFDFSCVKKCIMEEPIVDVVEETAVATTASCILELDLHTCTVQDLDFCVPYCLAMQRKDSIHAMVFWFDVHFTHCHKSICLSTAPHKQYTHWKQAVVYLEDVLMGCENETIQGLIAIKKNNLNKRDIDIKLHYYFQGQIGTHERTQCYRMR